MISSPHHRLPSHLFSPKITVEQFASLFGYKFSASRTTVLQSLYQPESLPYCKHILQPRCPSKIRRNARFLSSTKRYACLHHDQSFLMSLSPPHASQASLPHFFDQQCSNTWLYTLTCFAMTSSSPNTLPSTILSSRRMSPRSMSSWALAPFTSS